jgi:hypothetical protein
MDSHCATQAAPRVLFMRAFAYLFEARPSGLNPLAILRASPEFSAARQGVNEAVAGDFAAARDAARALEEYRKVWEFGQAWDGNAYAAQGRGLAEVRGAAAAAEGRFVRHMAVLVQQTNLTTLVMPSASFSPRPATKTVQPAPSSTNPDPA